MTHPEPPGPSRDELWRRHQLALSVLNQRGRTAETAELVQRVLDGEPIEALRGAVVAAK
jgi:hypothetical protein